MYYRRKIIFALLEKFEKSLTNTEIQKLVFLITKLQKDKKSYQFVPYLYGCYSFQLNDDLNAMFKRDMINKIKTDSSNIWLLNNTEEYFHQLNDVDKKIILTVKRKFSQYTISELIKHTYIKYPFYAINSTILDKMLNAEEKVNVINQKSKFIKDFTKLFTIGYEGITLEEYLNRLIINDVKILCDVRKNPFSMKRGFSKKDLKKACESLGIEYVHIPNLGIVSEKRKELNTQKDYNVLFKEYELTVLKENVNEIRYVYDLLIKYKRIALTCFEAEYCMCHRSRVSKEIENVSQGKLKAQHI
jgi:uncharacterized protein (DUF488 family)